MNCDLKVSLYEGAIFWEAKNNCKGEKWLPPSYRPKCRKREVLFSESENREKLSKTYLHPVLRSTEMMNTIYYACMQKAWVFWIKKYEFSSTTRVLLIWFKFRGIKNHYEAEHVLSTVKRRIPPSDVKNYVNTRI